jgi:hypothetical protein
MENPQQFVKEVELLIVRPTLKFLTLGAPVRGVEA